MKCLLQVILFSVCLAAAHAIRRHPTCHSRCGLPRYASQLPEERRRALEAIWEDYEKGEDCSEQRRKTLQFMSTLSYGEGEAAFTGLRGRRHLMRVVDTQHSSTEEESDQNESRPQEILLSPEARALYDSLLELKEHKKQLLADAPAEAIEEIESLSRPRKIVQQRVLRRGFLRRFPAIRIGTVRNVPLEGNIENNS